MPLDDDHEARDAERPHWRHRRSGDGIEAAGVGPTKVEAFRQAALALTGVVTAPTGVRTATPFGFQCQAASDDLLLLGWLNALVTEMVVRSMVFGEFALALADGSLRALAWGEPLDHSRHRPAVTVTRATMTALRVARVPGGWRVEYVVAV